jgi:hypothetical protein
MVFRELWNQPEYSDYPFQRSSTSSSSLNERAKGTMILPRRLQARETGRFVHVETYGSLPVQLNDLRQRSHADGIGIALPERGGVSQCPGSRSSFY